MNSVYKIITDEIIKSLNEGEIPWRKPWNSAFGPKNLASKKTYQGLNVFLLNTRKYKSNYWVTFNQAKKLGGSIKKGEKSRLVVYYKTWEKKTGKQNVDGTPEVENIPVIRYYRVFNIEQTEGLTMPVEEKLPEFDPIEKAEEIAKGYPDGPTVDEGAFDRACYNPHSDLVTMPDRKTFEKREEFYSTLFHELTHSTGHESRLKRHDSTSYFGSEDYSKEELIAEMGAAFLCGESNIERETLENSKAYIQNWIKVLKNDPKMVAQAAGKASKSTDLILKRKKNK